MSWIVQLPSDLGLPHDVRADVGRIGPFHGWTGADLPRLPRWDQADQDVHPVVALRFRRARVGVGMPTEATDRCFSDMQTATLGLVRRALFRLALRRLVARGVHEWKTVVRITRWYPASDLDGHADFEAWVRDEFRRGLATLNRWLATYALTSGSLIHGPVSPADLPLAIPTVLEGKDRPDSDVVYGHRLIRIHDTVPALLPADGNLGAADLALRSLVMDQDDNPFLEGLQLLFGAQTHLACGRERQAILDGGTGVEMLVSSVVRAVGKERDSFDAARATKAPFRGRFEHHLPLALGDGAVRAPDRGGARARWWSKGYLVRNAVVHQGHEADRAAARDAVKSAWDLVEALGQQLRTSSDTEHLGALLRVVWHGPEAPH